MKQEDKVTKNLPILAYHAGPHHAIHCFKCIPKNTPTNKIIPITSNKGWETKAYDCAVRCEVCNKIVFYAYPWNSTQ